MVRASSHFLKELVPHMRRRGLNVDRLLCKSGISSQILMSNCATMDDRPVCELIRSLWHETGDASMGFEVEAIPIDAFLLACDYMVAAETLAQLYRRFSRVFAVLPPESFGFEFCSDSKHGILTIHCNVGDSEPNYFWMELLAIVAHRLPSWAIDESIKLSQVTFPCAPPNHSAVHERIFDCEVKYSQPGLGLRFCSKYLDMPIQRSRAELHQWLKNSPSDLLYLPGNDSTVQTRIKGILMRTLRSEASFPAFEDLCNSLCMSGQVVRRRLAEEGASYQKIKDQVRFNLVKELLGIREMSLVDITWRVGYTESSTLSRAFRNWTGETLLNYRRRILEHSEFQ